MAYSLTVETQGVKMKTTFTEKLIVGTLTGVLCYGMLAIVYWFGWVSADFPAGWFCVGNGCGTIIARFLIELF